jgi:hypothetical protein
VKSDRRDAEHLVRLLLAGKLHAVRVPAMRRRRSGIWSATGSGHARRLLVKAAWHDRPRPKIGRALAAGQADQPPQAIAVAWSAQRRLHRTWTRLEARAKRRTIIAVAAARELAGFAWAITQIE